MSLKSPADVKSSDYCYEHGLYFERFCPDCRLEEWEMFREQCEPETGGFVRLNEI